MQTKKKYLLLLICCAFLSKGYFYYSNWKKSHGKNTSKLNLKSFMSLEDIVNDSFQSNKSKNYSTNILNKNGFVYNNCRMETCFDFSLCDRDFKVYVYPIDDNVAPNSNYEKVIKSIQSSLYYTSDPSQACLFVLSFDTLDRDKLSKYYVRNMPSRINRLALWNGGQNHIIFNMFSGSWPDYAEDLGFDIGKAILAKASMSLENYRPGFDISLPLSLKSHPGVKGLPGMLNANYFPASKKYLLGFKGKRYLYGIGSETRNSLHHLHNEKDIVLVTTCRHGGSWREYKDDKCDQDNSNYDKFDYEELLRNSSFCLVPRGRRLGSFRFLEVLQTGCIPVLLGNGWVLPFSEVIDWSSAAVIWDERLLLQVPDEIRSMNASKLLSMRQTTQILWERYFSSVNKIIHTVFEIVLERIKRFRVRTLAIWNSVPGAHNINLDFSDHFPHFPFFQDLTANSPAEKFTAVVSISYGFSGSSEASYLFKVIQNISKSKFVDKIYVLWGSAQKVPATTSFPSGNIPLRVVPMNSLGTARYNLYSVISTNAVFTIDEGFLLSSEEMDFAFVVWKSFPDRIVGYPARTHYWSEKKDQWVYTSQWLNSYSIVLTGAAIYHRYYMFLYLSYNRRLKAEGAFSGHNCSDLLLNFIVSDITKRPPIKLSRRKRYFDSNFMDRGKSMNSAVFHQRSKCLNTFSEILGSMPLLPSSFRLDPVLFGDKVSIQRKKYRHFEVIR